MRAITRRYTHNFTCCRRPGRSKPGQAIAQTVTACNTSAGQNRSIYRGFAAAVPAADPRQPWSEKRSESVALEERNG